MTWETDIRTLAARYTEGEAAVKVRRNARQEVAEHVLVPTFERAAAALRSAGMTEAGVERISFGSALEAVQLSRAARDWRLAERGLCEETRPG